MIGILVFCEPIVDLISESILSPNPGRSAVPPITSIFSRISCLESKGHFYFTQYQLEEVSRGGKYTLCGKAIRPNELSSELTFDTEDRIH